ncbi:MAG: 16S rRNA (guanine(527)-N(7))-methyltransferase RsmG [Clostridia bacterium]|nr:16S rRNA (guanine(527)-N(7))-methyltransferase RsmG [Clostridia bacterium]
MNNLKLLAEQININLSDEKLEKFFQYKEMLKEWNEKINLTAIIEDEEIILKHFIDSLTIEKYIGEKVSLIDVGTGAGFPGIPLKIVRNDLKVTLMDSLNKRLIFLDNVCKNLELNDIKTVHGRAEDIGKDIKYREKFDIATARAVANMSVLLEYCLPFVKVGGLFICMKGNNIEEVDEAEKALIKLGGKIEKIEKMYLPGTDIERNIIIVRKIKNTPKEYPRKAGVPSKNPIK